MNLAIYYFIFVIVGLFLAWLYGRHTKNFLWREYAAILAFPLLGIVGLVKVMGWAPLKVFVVASLVGPTLE